MENREDYKKSVLLPFIYFRGYFDGEAPMMRVEEITRYAWRARVDDEATKGLLNDDKICFSNGLYWLKDATPRRRDERLVATLKAKSQRAVRLARLSPFVRCVGVMNSVAIGYPHRGSDVDLFVITASGRLWTARWTFLFWQKVFDWKSWFPRQPKAGRLSAELFVSEEAVDLSKAGIPQDYLLAYWVSDFYPVFGSEAFRRFWSANGWLADILPQAYKSPRTYEGRVVEGGYAWTVFIESILSGGVGDAVERLTGWFERRRIGAKIKKRSTAKSLIIVSDRMVKVHFDDSKRVRINRDLDEFLA